MRILYAITRACQGGAQTHVLQLIKAAVAENEVMLATGEEGSLCEQVRSIGASVAILPSLHAAIGPLHDLQAVREVGRLLREWQPALVHAHSGKAGLVARLAAAGQHVPSIYTAHGFAFRDHVSPLVRMFSLAGEWIGAKAGDFTIAVSQSECALAARLGIALPNKCEVIYNGIANSGLRASPEVDPPVILMVARFAPPKQQELLIRAFERVSKSAKLWFVGDGPALAAAREVAASSVAVERIEFLGARRDVPEVLAQVQVAVLASAHEGFGLSLVEAMSVGLPVVATDTGGMHEIVKQEYTGILVPPGDECALSVALERLVQDPRLRKRMGREGLVRYGAMFTEGDMVEKTFRVYNRVLTMGCGDLRWEYGHDVQPSEGLGD